MQFRNPFNKSYCFFCGKAFYIGECAICSATETIPGDNGESQPKILKSRIEEWDRRLLSRLIVSNIKEDDYEDDKPCRQCPHCKKLLPFNIEWARNIILPIIGDNVAGKTLLIGALIHEMEEGPVLQMPEIRGFIALDQDVDKRYQDTFGEFFESGKMPARNSRIAADELPDPWIYRFKVRKLPQDDFEEVNLIIYDASGEDLRDMNVVRKQLKYLRLKHLRHSGAMIYVIDPLKIPGIANQVSEDLRNLSTNTNLPTAGQGPNRGPDYVFKWVVDSIQSSIGRNKQRLSIPAVILLSKSDYLQEIRPQATFLRNATYHEGLDKDDMDSVDAEVQTLLRECQQQVLLNAVDDFQKVLYYATSATGYPPDPQTKEFTRIESRRCADLLLWILRQFSLIYTKQEKQQIQQQGVNPPATRSYARWQ